MPFVFVAVWWRLFIENEFEFSCGPHVSVYVRECLRSQMAHIRSSFLAPREVIHLREISKNKRQSIDGSEFLGRQYSINASLLG